MNCEDLGPTHTLSPVFNNRLHDEKIAMTANCALVQVSVCGSYQFNTDSTEQTETIKYATAAACGVLSAVFKTVVIVIHSNKERNNMLNQSPLISTHFLTQQDFFCVSVGQYA